MYGHKHTTSSDRGAEDGRKLPTGFRKRQKLDTACACVAFILTPTVKENSYARAIVVLNKLRHGRIANKIPYSGFW